ncbi:unnamed protein product [Microthlaspi erraticum]|uniref:Integrase catalytic domain-containing protein n=2 Tax=Microthlaspi erraticum TaxID=1685480 RepID=A0A6D2IU72_9BRAS|nr:unnamed protein product [Microthlaspi erraticum]
MVAQFLKNQQRDAYQCENMGASHGKDKEECNGDNSHKQQGEVNYIDAREERLEAMMQQLMENQQHMMERQEQNAQEIENLEFKMANDYGHLNRKDDEIFAKLFDLTNHVKMLEVQVAQTAEGMKRQEGFLPSKTELNPRVCKVITTQNKDVVSPAPRDHSTLKNPLEWPEDDEPIYKGPHQRKLHKMEDPGQFVFPCTINGMDFIDSLCDTGANVNVMSKLIADELGIVDIKDSQTSLKFGNASTITPYGFAQDILVQVGGCLVPTDFHILEMNEEPLTPLVFGSSFLATVGANVDYPNQRVSFSRVKKRVFYPAVPTKSSYCITIRNGSRLSLDHGEEKEKPQNVSKQALYIRSYEVIKSVNSDHESCLRDKVSTVMPKECDADSSKEVFHLERRPRAPPKPAPSDTPWFRYIANYLAADHPPPQFFGYKKKKFLRDVRRYFWDEPYLYKHCSDGMFRRCIPEEEVPGVLFACHGSDYAGHFATNKTVAKILQAGFWWPTMFKDAHDFISKCDACQRQGNISKRNEMPQNFIQEVEVFDVWGIDFMGPFPSSYGNKYILVAVDYVSKWVEAIASPTNDSKVVIKLFKSIIFPRFGIPRVVISDGGSHFINKVFESLLKKNGVRHKVATPYHPQTSGQNCIQNPTWNNSFSPCLWKACHLPVEIEYKAEWAVKKLNYDIKTAKERRLIQLNELDEIRHNAYENSRIYKERTKAYHDKKIVPKTFSPNDQVLLFNSRLKLFPGKLRSRWSGPFKIKEVKPYGAVVLWNRSGGDFTVNGQRLKPYLADIDEDERETVPLVDAPLA